MKNSKDSPDGGKAALKKWIGIDTSPPVRQNSRVLSYEDDFDTAVMLGELEKEEAELTKRWKASAPRSEEERELSDKLANLRAKISRIKKTGVVLRSDVAKED